MKKKSLLWLTALVLVMSMFLAACGGKKTEGEPGKSGGNKQGSAKDGGTVILAAGAKPEGIFNVNFYGNASDSEVLDLMDDGLLTTDENLKPKPNIASWETEDNKVFKFTFKKGVKWHNGDELVVDDWIFALETLANKDYDGPRYSNVETVEGAPAFKEGKAKEISGLKKIDDYNIEITFDKARVNNLDNLWTYPLNRTEFKDIPVKDMSASPQVRQKPVGLGPFKVNKIIPGESIEFVRFDDYWQGKPHLDKIIYKVIDPSLTVGELQNNKIHVTEFIPANYEEIKKLDNVEVIKTQGLVYYYVGFKFGHRIGEKNVMDNPKFHDKKLRHAMAHAINRDEWVKTFYYGLGKPTNTVVPSIHWTSADPSELKDYKYDPEMAKQLLEEAGYKDVDGDGFREDPKGKKLVINFQHPSGPNPTFEPRAKQLVQYWEEVGLKVKLNMPEATLNSEMIDKDEKSVEVFFGGWSVGSDPDPTAIWESNAFWNRPRWVNEESDKLMADALDIEIVGTDEAKRKDLYVKWQQLINEEIPLFPLLELEDTIAINKIVKGLTYSAVGKNSAHEWYIEK